MGKGGVYGSYVAVKLSKGTSRRFPLAASGASPQKAAANNDFGTSGGKSEKSPIAFMKQPVAEFFGFPKLSPTDLLKASTKTVTTKINGKTETITVVTRSGATGASRSVTVRFKAMETIGGKSVASVKIAVPSSHTFGDMQNELMNCPAAAKIAQIVSFSGRVVGLDTPVRAKSVAGGKSQPRIAPGRR